MVWDIIIVMSMMMMMMLLLGTIDGSLLRISYSHVSRLSRMDFVTTIMYYGPPKSDGVILYWLGWRLLDYRIEVLEYVYARVYD
jgi:hypothetical protein